MNQEKEFQSTVLLFGIVAQRVISVRQKEASSVHTFCGILDASL
jgi:hypothetical protein